MAELFYDDGNLTGRVVNIEELTPDEMREALDGGARWRQGDEWLFVRSESGECELHTIWENQNWKKIKEQEILLNDDGTFEVVEEEEEEV